MSEHLPDAEWWLANRVAVIEAIHRDADDYLIGVLSRLGLFGEEEAARFDRG